MTTLNVLASLNRALHALLRDDERVMLLGEDLLDPYGGAFKIAKGLSTAFPDRVLTTPLSESGFTAVAAGLAMRGMRPIVEIMFGDFLMLCADQMLNHIGKYRWMYNDLVRVPVVIRTPMGGRRGYGPTHSQSLEKFFVGMPGWSVVAPSPFHDPGALLRAAVDDDDPVLFVENKVMYARPLRGAGANGMVGDFHVRTTEGPYPTITLSFDPFRRADVTLVAYGGMAELAATAADNLLIQEEVLCEVVIPSQIAPLAPGPILESLARTGALVCCEEGTERAGWSAEVVAMVTTTAFGSLRAPPIRVAARDLPIANTSTLENATLPQVADIEAAILKAHSSPRRAITR